MRSFSFDPERDERARLETESEHLECAVVQAQQIGANLAQARADVEELKVTFARQAEQTREMNAMLDRMIAAYPRPSMR